MADAYKFSQLMKDLSLKNTFRFLGENKNSATLIACSIAAFKGIFRPLFTMMDKKSDLETRKYAAIREGLTEVAAFPLYALTPLLVGKIVDKTLSKETSEIIKDKIKMNSKFLGICVATLIIPAVCNAIQPPMMKAYKKSQDKKKAKLDINTNIDTVQNKIANDLVFKAPTPVAGTTKLLPPRALQNNINSGLKVGG